MRDLIDDRAFQTALRGGLAILLLVGAVVFVQRAWDILQPLIVSTVVATALWPWVGRMASVRFGPRGWRLPPPLAAALVYVTTVCAAGVVVWLFLTALLPEIDQGLAMFPDQTGFIRDYLQAFRTGDIAGGATQLAGDVARETSNAAANAQAPGGPINVGALALALFGGVLHLGLVLVFSFFLLVDGERVAGWVLRLVPCRRRAHARCLGAQIRDRISRWVVAQIIYGSLSGAVIWLFMTLVQLPTPWLYGMIGATLGIFPGLGPWVATVPAFVVALGLSTWQASAVAIFGVAMYVVDSTMLSAKIYGELLQLPMFVVLLALFIGAALMGVWGAMIAAPVAAAVHSVLQDQLD